VFHTGISIWAYSSNWEEANHQKWYDISILPWQFPTY